MTATKTPEIQSEMTQAAPVSRKPSQFKPRLLSIVQKVLPLLAVLGLWAFVSYTGLVNPRYIPTPGVVADTWLDWVFGYKGSAAGHRYSGTWIQHVTDSAERVLTGFAIAAVAGTLLGLLIGWFRPFQLALDPIIQFLRPIPITAWVPFMVVLFGLDPQGAVFLIALGAFFPIVLNTTAGAHGTPRVLVRAASMLGTPRTKILYRVVFPSALPSIFTGLRLGLGIAWVLVVVAEMLAVRSGLGYVMWDAYNIVRMDLIVATMLSVGLLGFLSDVVLAMIQNRVLQWSEGLYR